VKTISLRPNFDMTKYFIVAAFMFCMTTLQAQTSQSNATKKGYAAPSRDYIMIQVGTEQWTNLPDSIKTTSIGRVFNAYLCYDFPISKSNFSFAAGAGIGTSNIYFKDQIINLSDTTPAIQFLPEGATNYKKYKLSTAYVEAPFEIRYFSNKDNRNKGFKAAVGLRVGALISSKTKGKYTLNSKPINDKVVTKRYIETWRYAATLRLGYGNFSVYGAYNISNLFRVNSGPENIRPFQVGVCLSGL
jgi:hypothetical protein